MGRQHKLAVRQADGWSAWLAGRWVGSIASWEMDGKAYMNEQVANRHMNRKTARWIGRQADMGLESLADSWSQRQVVEQANRIPIGRKAGRCVSKIEADECARQQAD